MKTIYADTDCGRLGAVLDGDIVHVWQVRGFQLGGYRLTRFEGNKLTPKTLAKLFERPDPEPWEGCTDEPVGSEELQRLIAEDERSWR